MERYYRELEKDKESENGLSAMIYNIYDRHDSCTIPIGSFKEVDVAEAVVKFLNWRANNAKQSKKTA